MNIIFKPFIFVTQKLWLFTLTLKTRCEHKSKTKNVLRESPNSCYKYHACCCLGNEIMTVLTQNSVKWGFLNIRSLKRMPTNNGRKWRGTKETDTKKQVQMWASVMSEATFMKTNPTSFKVLLSTAHCDNWWSQRFLVIG